MKRRTTGVGLALVAALVNGPVRGEIRDSQTFRESYELAPGGRVVVNNVWGSIDVIGTSGDRVELVIEKTVVAEDQQALERYREEIDVLIESVSDLLDVYVDGPFRADDDRFGWNRRHWNPRYEINFDFELRVPAGIELDIRTVTDGEIHVEGVRGNFDVSNVNGGIEMKGLAGSGEVKTVNGPIRIEFLDGPDGASSFTTVNGDVEVFFPEDLSADLQMTSRFGEMWSEFPVESLPVQPVVSETRNGTTTIKREGSLVRVATGGPRLSFETLNGDVLIKKHARGGTR